MIADKQNRFWLSKVRKSKYLEPVDSPLCLRESLPLPLFLSLFLSFSLSLSFSLPLSFSLCLPLSFSLSLSLSLIPSLSLCLSGSFCLYMSLSVSVCLSLSLSVSLCFSLWLLLKLIRVSTCGVCVPVCFFCQPALICKHWRVCFFRALWTVWSNGGAISVIRLRRLLLMLMLLHAETSFSSSFSTKHNASLFNLLHEHAHIDIFIEELRRL